MSRAKSRVRHRHTAVASGSQDIPDQAQMELVLKQVLHQKSLILNSKNDREIVSKAVRDSDLKQQVCIITCTCLIELCLPSICLINCS